MKTDIYLACQGLLGVGEKLGRQEIWGVGEKLGRQEVWGCRGGSGGDEGGVWRALEIAAAGGWRGGPELG
jgi:hypothetical protein